MLILSVRTKFSLAGEKRDDVIKFTLNSLGGLSETKDSRAATGIALCEVNQACTQRIFFGFRFTLSNSFVLPVLFKDS